MSSTRVSFYGLHTTEQGFDFLLQGKNQSPFGLYGDQIGCPFLVESKKECNHSIPYVDQNDETVSFEEIDQIKKDPLIQAMLPEPRGLGQNIYYFEDPTGTLATYASILLKMTGAIKNPIFPTWSARLDRMQEELQRTNIQPLIITGCSAGDLPKMAKFIVTAAVSPRTLILIGDPNLPLTRRIIRKTDMATLFRTKKL